MVNNKYLWGALMSVAISHLALEKGQAATLKVNIFKLPELIETASVTTAGHYILASHLVRSLTKLDKFGKIQSDLAAKWHHSEDHKTWRIWIKDERFSNGETIKSTDVLNSLQRQVDLKTGVHFPFSDIVKLSLDKENSIVVQLANPRMDFIYDLSKPEFGVLYKSDFQSKKGEMSFAITSGPYILSGKKGTSYFLKRNKFFKIEVKNDLDLIMEDSDGDKSYKALVDGKIDFLTTQQNLSLERHREIERIKGLSSLKPHVAFSYWLSLNPESYFFKNSSNRSKLQAIVKDFSSPELNEHTWQKADQLYLPDGDGRPTADELKSVWQSITKHPASSVIKMKPKLRVVPLKMTNSLIADLLKYLGSFYVIEIIPYTTEQELVKIIQSNDFDLKISSNDFSSIDLSENLKTTFNASRPYIFLNKNSVIMGLMKRAASLTDKSEQSKIYKQIGLTLLQDGLIAPLAYQRVWFYHKTKVDISAWSTIFPEISFWKVKVNE